MSEIKIENKIPVPNRNKYPFAKMKKGDSILLKVLLRGV